MAHLFTGDLIEGGFFYDFQVGLPLIVKMKWLMHLFSEWKDSDSIGEIENEICYNPRNIVSCNRITIEPTIDGEGCISLCLLIIISHVTAGKNIERFRNFTDLSFQKRSTRISCALSYRGLIIRNIRPSQDAFE
jgi:hypothetical protein